MNANNPYEQHLDKVAANHVPLSPLEHYCAGRIGLP